MTPTVINQPRQLGAIAYPVISPAVVSPRMVPSTTVFELEPVVSTAPSPILLLAVGAGIALAVAALLSD